MEVTPVKSELDFGEVKVRNGGVGVGVAQSNSTMNIISFHSFLINVTAQSNKFTLMAAMMNYLYECS